MSASMSAPIHIPARAVIVDLDGTMVDTLGDFVVVLQHTLADMGCHPIEIGRASCRERVLTDV